MLSDHEWKTLREVKQRFTAEDPEFPRSFEAREVCLPRRPRRRGTSIALVVGGLLVALMLIVGSLAGALVVAATTGMIWMAWRDPVALDQRTQGTAGE